MTLSPESPVVASSRHGGSKATSDDPARPVLHIHPEHGWLNDPNGLCRIDGTYHVFFQFNPAEPVHANVHWGHVSSPDLLHWITEPIALAPRPGSGDEGGCWSGCVVDDAGVPTAVYTGVRSSAHDAGVVLARSDRSLRSWVSDDTWRIGTPEDEAISDVRDPFVFLHDGRRYAVQGAGHVMGSPQLLLYACDDLGHWTYLRPFLSTDDPVAAATAAANIWECPNLVRLGDAWVLLLSLWRNHVLSGVRYLVGDVVAEADGLRFVSRTGGTLDTGPTFYAPQVLVEADRVLLWGWAWEGADRSDEAIREAGWCGTLTSPRELTLVDGHVRCQPATELAALRRDTVACGPRRPITDRAFEVLAKDRVLLRTIDPDSGEEHVVTQSDGPARILVDGSLVETFGPHGSYTTRHYPGPRAHWLVETDGPVQVWRLGLPD
ncbi:MAG TPA: glycoside hydrolase family 32 protein [Microlunatus sp.]|nr:glycoside hydrolase family 32 protein [Microlunatus sp.]